MSIAIFTQNMGAAISLVAGNALFSNSLQKELQKRIASIGTSPDAIVAAGVRSIRQLVSGSALAAVLEAYCKAIDDVMYFGIGLSLGMLLFAWGLGWKDVRKVDKLDAITGAGDQPAAKASESETDGSPAEKKTHNSEQGESM